MKNNNETRFTKERQEILKILDRFDFSIPGVIKDSFGKSITIAQISAIIGKSLNQTKRLIKIYKQFKNGEINSFVHHKNINNDFKPRLDPKIESLLIQEYTNFMQQNKTYINKNAKFCVQSFADYFNNKYSNLVSDSSIYKYLKQNKIISDFANKKTKKQFKQSTPKEIDFGKK